jgi:hypothetical protein
MDAHVTGRYLNGKKPNLERVPHTFAHIPRVRNSVHIHRPHGDQRSGRFLLRIGVDKFDADSHGSPGCRVDAEILRETGNVAKYVRDIAGNRPRCDRVL